ncbi:hypothetical protein J437_LFUL015617, partial [Ladona fulva]
MAWLPPGGSRANLRRRDASADQRAALRHGGLPLHRLQRCAAFRLQEIHCARPLIKAGAKLTFKVEHFRVIKKLKVLEANVIAMKIVKDSENG